MSIQKSVPPDAQSGPLSNAEIADRLSSLAQLLTVEKANPYKVRAYRRAAAVIRGLGESLDELVRSDEDLLLKRPGYELDLERIIEHAKARRCFFELNSSPDRLDVSAENARLVRTAGIRIAISTDSHSTAEYRTLRYGIEQARRAGLSRADVLNCQPLDALLKLFEHR